MITLITDIDQLNLILQVLGSPSKEDFETIVNLKVSFIYLLYVL
ncbi:unnamed protein product [Schistosoma mattheei]|uniref:Uncharacterized protein n=1 Tax=Schistosoma mattheei TaxID=31246 RepID=A0A183NR13_9TREM|nr:unnamed protein product [Schistosoma mattheei]